MWMPSVLCLVLFLLSAYVLPCFALLCFFFSVFAFHDTFCPLSHPFVHLCLRNFRFQGYLMEYSLAFIFRLFRFLGT